MIDRGTSSNDRLSRVIATLRAPISPCLGGDPGSIVHAEVREWAEDPRRMARVFMRLELSGAALIVMWLLFPGDHLSKGWLSLLLLFGVVQAVTVGAWPRPLSPRAYGAQLALVVTALSVGIHGSGGAISPVDLFFLWAVAFSAWYLPGRVTTIAAIWISVAYGLALLAYRGPHDAHWWWISNAAASRWVLLSGTVTTTALLVTTFRASFLDHEQRFIAAFESSNTPMVLVDLDGTMRHVNAALCALLETTAEALVGREGLSIVAPSDRSTVQAFLDQGSGAQRGEMRLLRSDGTTIWVDVASSVVTDHHGDPRYYIAQALDVTARRTAEKRVSEQAAQHAAIADIGRSAVEGADVGTLAEHVASSAARLLGVDLAIVVEHDTGDEGCRIIGAGGPDADSLTGTQVQRWPLIQSALSLREPVIVADWRSEARFGMSDAERALPARSAVVTPLRAGQEPLGALVCESEEKRSFTVEDVNFLRGLASMFAATVERRRSQEQATRAVLYDALTGLPNRTLLADVLERKLLTAGGRKPIGVAFVDLDHFKLINDSLGQEVGDQVLAEAASRFAAVLRGSDMLARSSSDEFVVLCEDVSHGRAAMRVAQRLLSCLRRPFQVAGEEIHVGATVGVALTSKDTSAPSLLRDAEAAMHRAKERSRGGYELFDPAFHERNLGRLRTENALRRAIGSDELSVVFQPIVKPADDGVNSVEALVRWMHPEWGPVSPVEFIPIAEESGMIIPIGRKVMQDALRQLAAWNAEGRNLRMSVNVSARQLYDDVLPDLIGTTLEESGVLPSSLIIELTETALIADADAAHDALWAIKSTGVDLALDDYGSGYASLSYLSRFPFDIIKLDRSLIRGLGASRKDAIIVASTIDMGHALGLSMVGEGVETEAQDAMLTEFGCDLVQGYLYSRPLPPQALGELPLWRERLLAPATGPSDDERSAT